MHICYNQSMDNINELLTRGVANIIPSKEELEKVLKSGKKLNIYLGIDPTTPQIHLGHTVPLRKLQMFAELGHHVTFLIGDFTALIGDTSDKESERPALTHEQIEHNFQTYKKQAEKILDFSLVKVRYNSEWLKKLTFTDVVGLTQHFSLGDFISRELIKKRLQEGKRIGLHEVLYPTMQGYDSFTLDTDLQIGGTDQTFNMQAGRTLQKDLRTKESFILSTPFLLGTDKRKMSKTWGNAIWLNDEPNEMFGKVMSVSDDLIIDYYTLGTNMPEEAINEIKKRLENGENPIKIKKQLAHTIVTELHNKEAASKAGEYFERTFQKKEIPTEIPEIETSEAEEKNIVDLLSQTNVIPSKSEVKRLIQQGGIEVDSNIIKDPTQKLEKGEHVLRIGKKKFVKIKVI